MTVTIICNTTHHDKVTIQTVAILTRAKSSCFIDLKIVGRNRHAQVYVEKDPLTWLKRFRFCVVKIHIKIRHNPRAIILFK